MKALCSQARSPPRTKASPSQARSPSRRRRALCNQALNPRVESPQRGVLHEAPAGLPGTGVRIGCNAVGWEVPSLLPAARPTSDPRRREFTGLPETLKGGKIGWLASYLVRGRKERRRRRSRPADRTQSLTPTQTRRRPHTLQVCGGDPAGGETP